MICENCKCEHNGIYASGRFCSIKCSKGYSTKRFRDDINKKVSSTLKEKYLKNELFKEQLENARIKASNKGVVTIKNYYNNLFINAEWNDLPLTLKRKRVLLEQKNKCSICGIDSWLGEKITFHFDHIDGYKNNNSRENVRFICPNCHSQTETYCGKKQRLPQFEYLKTKKVV